MMRRNGFSLESGPVSTPGARLAVRKSAPRPVCLEAALDEDGELLIDPAHMLARSGSLALTPVAGNLARAHGRGSLIVGTWLNGEIALVRLSPEAAVLLAPGGFLMATGSVSIAHRALGDTAGWILLQASAEGAAFVAIAGRGAVAHYMLGAGEALDVAADALLIVDGPVDLAVGIHLDMPGLHGFVQCSGAGGIGVQAG